MHNKPWTCTQHGVGEYPTAQPSMGGVSSFFWGVTVILFAFFWHFMEALGMGGWPF
jgi:hypothetical protein